MYCEIVEQSCPILLGWQDGQHFAQAVTAYCEPSCIGVRSFEDVKTLSLLWAAA